MYIYKIKNKKNGKIYIGQTTRSIKERWRGHRSSSRLDNNNLFHNAINKHGEDAFEIEELAKADSKEQLDLLEDLYINSNDSLHPNGYNLKTGGSNGAVYSQESRRKMSDAKLGSTVPNSTKEKMSKAHKKRWVNDDGTLFKQRSEIVKQAWSDPTYRKKISKARKKYWSNSDNRQQAKKRGEKMASDPEYIKKVSEGVRAAHQRPEVKEKMRISHIERNKHLYQAFQDKLTNPDPNQKTVYVVSGIAGSGKSWVCKQLQHNKGITYVSYDDNRKKNHLDLIRNAPDGNIVLYDLNIKTSTFIRRNCHEFNIRFVTILGDFLRVKQQLKDRGGKITKGTYTRWKVMKKRAEQYAEFTGDSYQVLQYLKNI